MCHVNADGIFGELSRTHFALECLAPQKEMKSESAFILKRLLGGLTRQSDGWESFVHRNSENSGTMLEFFFKIESHGHASL